MEYQNEANIPFCHLLHTVTGSLLASTAYTQHNTFLRHNLSLSLFPLNYNRKTVRGEQNRILTHGTVPKTTSSSGALYARLIAPAVRVPRRHNCSHVRLMYFAALPACPPTV